MHIRHVMLCEYTNSKNAAETVKKCTEFFSQGVITDHQVKNWLLKFVLEICNWEMDPEQDAHQDAHQTAIKML